MEAYFEAVVSLGLVTSIYGILILNASSRISYTRRVFEISCSSTCLPKNVPRLGLMILSTDR